ncbi:MAG: dockerin type I repeat-containing protein [Prevotella sp.]|nr:dockerin type I repeat-containing protein [Prevotella sp.]
MNYPIFKHIRHFALVVVLGLSSQVMGQTATDTSTTDDTVTSDGIAHISSKILHGDANNDGHINISDVTVIINKIIGKEPQDFFFANADVDSNGLINISDVTKIINIILYGITDSDDPRLPTGDPDGGDPEDGI